MYKVLVSITQFLPFKSQELEKALDVMVQDPSFILADHSAPLVNRLAALHIVYKQNSQQIMLFGQLVSLNPGILLYLSGRQAPVVSSEIVRGIVLCLYNCFCIL